MENLEEQDVKVERDVAEKEILFWLDKKKISPSTREKNKDEIELLIDRLCDGTLVYHADTNSFTHTLLFPMENEKPLHELKYKGRINDIMLKPNLSGIKPGDGYATLLGYIQTLTGVNRNILAALDSSDKKIASAIAVFFL